jgi:death-on-curing protein
MTARENDGSGTFPPIVLTERMDFDSLAESIFEVHKSTVQQTTGLDFSEVISHDRKAIVLSRIISVLDPIFGTHFGSSPKDLFHDVFEQISVFAEHLAKDHIFADGNKRTTVRVSLGLLAIQAIQLDIEDNPEPRKNEIYLWIQDLVTGRRTTMELSEYLRLHAKPIGEGDLFM